MPAIVSPKLLPFAILFGLSSLAFAADPVLCNTNGLAAQCQPNSDYLASYPSFPRSTSYRGGDTCPRVSTPAGYGGDTYLPTLCVPAAVPPPFQSLRCTPAMVFFPTRYVVDCEAYPKSATISYGWLTSGVLLQTYPDDPSSNVREFTCQIAGPASVTVFITSPFGKQSTQSVTAICGGGLPQMP